MEHNIYGQFLGYYFNLSAFLSQHPKGVPGDCFINGETLSLWVWDTMNRKWIDSNRPDNWLKGIIDNPHSFIPDVKPGVKTAYLYIAPEAAKVTFSFFKNGETAISVQTKSSAIISLFWNGDYWESAVTEIDTDLSALARKDLSNIEETTFKSKNILKTIYLKYDFSTDGLLSNLAPNDSDNGTITSILNENINGNCVLYAMDNHNCVSPCHVLSDSAKSEYTLTLICADNKIHTVTLNSSGKISSQQLLSASQTTLLSENGIEEYVACVEKSAYIQSSDFAVIENSNFTLLRKIKLAVGQKIRLERQEAGQSCGMVIEGKYGKTFHRYSSDAMVEEYSFAEPVSIQIYWINNNPITSVKVYPIDTETSNPIMPGTHSFEITGDNYGYVDGSSHDLISTVSSWKITSPVHVLSGATVLLTDGAIASVFYNDGTFGKYTETFTATKNGTLYVYKNDGKAFSVTIEPGYAKQCIVLSKYGQNGSTVGGYYTLNNASKITYYNNDDGSGFTQALVDYKNCIFLYNGQMFRFDEETGSQVILSNKCRMTNYIASSFHKDCATIVNYSFDNSQNLIIRFSDNPIFRTEEGRYFKIFEDGSDYKIVLQKGYSLYADALDINLTDAYSLTNIARIEPRTFWEVSKNYGGILLASNDISSYNSPKGFYSFPGVIGEYFQGQELIKQRVRSVATPVVNESILEKVPKFTHLMRTREEDVTIVFTGSSTIMGRPYTTERLDAGLRPPLLQGNDLCSLIWDCISAPWGQEYRTFQSDFFTETGDWETTINAGNWGDADGQRPTRTSTGSNAAIGFTIPARANYFNYIYRACNQSGNQTISVAEGNGAVEVFDYKTGAWVEANGYVLDANTDSIVSAMNLAYADNTIYQMRMKMRKLSSSEVSMTLTKSSGTRMNYIGVEWTRGENFLYLINAGRGGWAHWCNNSTSNDLNQVQGTDILVFKPNLLMGYITIGNCGVNWSSNQEADYFTDSMKRAYFNEFNDADSSFHKTLNGYSDCELCLFTAYMNAGFGQNRLFDDANRTILLRKTASGKPVSNISYYDNCAAWMATKPCASIFAHNLFWRWAERAFNDIYEAYTPTAKEGCSLMTDAMHANDNGCYYIYCVLSQLFSRL